MWISRKKYTFDEEKVIDKEEFESYILKPSNEESEGKFVSFGAQIINVSEEDDDFIYYQVYADPMDFDQSLVILVGKEKEKLKREDVIKVEGVIVGEAVGENAFGAEISDLAVRLKTLKNHVLSMQLFRV